MDNISVSGTFPKETEGLVIRNTSKRKHSDYVDNNENTKKKKIDLQNDQAGDYIKVENEEELLQSDNDVSPENKEENVRPTHSELNEIKIAHLKENVASSLDEQNELKSNLITSQIESDKESTDYDTQIISKNDDSQFDQSEISCEKEKTDYTATNTVCETVSESDTNSQNIDDSSTTGIGTIYSSTSAVPDAEPNTREEANTHPKLYRLLREGENKNNGLRAKFPGSNTSVANHVANGSKGRSSKYISTCSNLFAAYNLLELKTNSRRYRNGNKKIVEIDVNRLPLDVSIIDLTSEELRTPYEVSDEDTNYKFHKFAQSHGEVLLVGKIPADCLEYT